MTSPSPKIEGTYSIIFQTSNLLDKQPLRNHLFVSKPTRIIKNGATSTRQESTDLKQTRQMNIKDANS